MNGLAILRHRHLGLMALAGLIVTIHITLVLRSQSVEQFNLSLLIWLAVAYQLMEKTQPLQAGDDGTTPFEKEHRRSTLIGTMLLAVMLFKIPQVSGPGLFLCLFPLGCAFGFTLIAVGRSHLLHYWKELSIIAVLAIPGEKVLAKLLEVVLMGLTQENLATLTARFVVMVMRILGSQVSVRGTEIILTNTIVHVDEGCSGARGMDFLLRLALVALLMFSAHRLQRIFIPLSAVAIAFSINGVRATIMSYLANRGNMAAFDYWHLGDGSQLFGLAAVLCFVGVCYKCLQLTPKSPSIPGGEPPSW